MIGKTRRQSNLLNREEFLVGGRGNLVVPHKHYVPYPPVNAKKTEDCYELRIAVPGFQKEDLSIKVNNSFLVVKGVHSEEHNHQDEAYLLKEYDYNTFERDFHLADFVDKDQITVQYEDGVLLIKLYAKEDEEVVTKERFEVPIE